MERNVVHLIESSPGNILSGEDYIEIAETLINEKPSCVFLFDSFSQLCTKARRDSDVSDRFRDDTPLLIATFCKRISNVLPVNRSVFLGIVHLISNQTPGAKSPWAEASGQKLKYAVDVKLRATHTTPVMVGEIQVAQEVHWKIESSAIGRPGTCTSILRYGYGIDKEAELVQLASEAGVIPKGGSWYTLPSGEKLQGLENIRNVLVEKPEIYQEINKKFRELLRLDG